MTMGKYQQVSVENIRKILSKKDKVSHYEFSKMFINTRENENYISPVIYEMFRRGELEREKGTHAIPGRGQQVWYYKLNKEYKPIRASPQMPRKKPTKKTRR
jgi:hypothetical protein